MKTLSFDLSHKRIHIGIYHKEHFEPLIEQNLEKAELLPLLLKQRLAEEAIEINSFDKLAIMTGPGNYTSLRAGIILARSIFYVNQIKLFAKNRLEVMFYLMRHVSSEIMAIQNVRQNQYYVAIGRFENEEIVYSYEPRCLEESELELLWNKDRPKTCGDWPMTDPGTTILSQKLVAALGEWASASKIITPINEVLPFYIRPAAALSK